MKRSYAFVIAMILSLIVLAAIASSASAYENGRLPGSALSPANVGYSCDGPGDELANRAAAGWNTMALWAGKPLPGNGCASLYRPVGSPSDGCSSGTQWGFWRCYGAGRAAYPGTSNHGLGLAVDMPPWVRATVDRSGGVFGFWKPCSDAAHESWHVKFCRSFARPDPGINRTSPDLERGSGGPGQAPYVRQVQHLLRRAGAKRLAVDGDLGRKTCTAIKAFRKARGFERECKVGPNLWRQLRGPVTRDREKLERYSFTVNGPVNGVDVSQHQGSVNWDAVEQAGYDFAIVKSSEGGDYIDPRFNQARVEAIHEQGLRLGVYHYLRPRPGRTGAVEAAFFMNVIQAAGYGVGDMIPVVDIEESALSPASTCVYLRQFVRTVRKQLGSKTIVYTSQFGNPGAQSLGQCPNLGDWLVQKPLWIAAPGDPDPYTGPWASYTIHQHSFTGRVPGISGDVDLNRIPGGREQLRALVLAEVPGYGGDPEDGTRDPVEGEHRNRPPCSKKDRPHRCHLRRRCARGHDRACRRLERAQREDRR